MLQQFGRTHRSNQVCPPHYVLLATDVGGEHRFASSIARRLEMLGAMTRGDRRGGHGAAADIVQYNLDTPLGHHALSILLEAVAEKAAAERLWQKALSMLRCDRDGVPMLLGLSLVALIKPDAKFTPEQLASVPLKLQTYVHKLRHWAASRVPPPGSRARGAEREKYGHCPRTPHPMSWTEAADALRRMKMLGGGGGGGLHVDDKDRYNINKFLNRLLGLPVATQNRLFAYFGQVFRWVVMSARSKGQLDTGVPTLKGEAVWLDGPPRRERTSHPTSSRWTISAAHLARTPLLTHPPFSRTQDHLLRPANVGVHDVANRLRRHRPPIRLRRQAVRRRRRRAERPHRYRRRAHRLLATE